MSQTWPTFVETSGGDSVKTGLLNQRTRTDDLRSSNSGTSAPAASLAVGMLWRDTTNAKLKMLQSTGPSVWVQVYTAGESSIPAADLATDCVETAKIKDANVTQAKLANSSVGTAQLIDANVTNAKMATDSVGTSNIIAANVTQAKLANSSVGTSQLIDANVTLAKMASNSVGSSQIVSAAVTTAKLADGSVTTAKLASGVGIFFNVVAKSAAYTASASDFVVATVGTSWTLTLPSTPSVNDRVGVYVASVTGSQVLTLSAPEGIAGYGTTLPLYVARERLELIYDGSTWVIVAGTLTQHRCQMSLTGFSRSSPGSSWVTLALDTADIDIGQLANVGSNRIDIRRTGIYEVRMNCYTAQVGPTYNIWRVLKNGAAFSYGVVDDNVHDNYADSSADRSGIHWSEFANLTAGDYLELQLYSWVPASANNRATLQVAEAL
jgi:hypothetical protein